MRSMPAWLWPFLLLPLLIARPSHPVGPYAAGAPPGGLERRVDSVVEATMRTRRIPGAAIVVIEHGKLRLLKGYGMADVERGTPVRPGETLFRIGSVSKALTATAVLALVDSGLISMDTPVGNVLDDIPALQGSGAPARVRHLLTHTAGFDQTGLGRHAESPATRASLAAFADSELVSLRPPGRVATYDTYGMTLAGLLLSRLAQAPYAEAMRRVLFRPLGMRHSGIEAGMARPADRATGYGLEDDTLLPQDYEYYVTLPASSVDATVADMGLLLQYLLAGDGSTGPLDGRTLDRLRFDPQFTYPGGSRAFSYGFWEDVRRGRRILQHGGVMAGYSSQLLMIPSDSSGFFIAYNRDPETGPDPRLREEIVAGLLDYWYGPEPDRRPPAPPARVPTAPLAGRYASTLGCFTCREPGGWGIGAVGLQAAGPGVLEGSSRWLAADSLVFVNERTGARMEFLPEPGATPRFMVIGTDSYVRIDDRLFNDVLGLDWASQPATLPRAVLYQNAERWKEAADAYEALLARTPSQGRYAFYTGFYGLKAGDPGQALRGFRESIRLGRWPEWSHYYIGAALASRGETDRALESLEQAVSLGFADSAALAADPWWNSLRATPRFVALMKRTRGD